MALCFACKHVRMLHFRIFARDLASLVQLSLEELAFVRVDRGSSVDERTKQKGKQA